MRRVPKAVWAILLLALVLRLGVATLLTDRLDPGADELAYRTIAASIADGDGYPDRPAAAGGGPSAANPPGYPYLLGAIFFASGDSVDAARVVQALLGTLAVALIGLIAWTVFARRAVALAALAIAAVYPPLVVISAPLMSESLLLPLLLGMVLAALRFRADHTLGWAALAGALGGAAVLTKDVGLVAFLIVLVAIWARPRLSGGSLRPPAVAIAVALAVLLPWQLRNALEFDSFVPVSTKLGLGLAGSYNETVRADPEHVWAPPYQLPELHGFLYGTDLDEAEVSRELQSRTLDFIRDHPGYPFALVYRNARRMTQLETSQPVAADAELLGFNGGASRLGPFRLVYWACALGFFALIALVVASALRGYAVRVPVFIFVLTALLVVPLLLIAAGPRYRLPADTLLIVIAAPAAAAVFERLSRGLARGRGAAEQPAPLTP
jgi:4-amino-4-deoxy-L-arabinose transferase-like glycosyltransferase